MSFSKPKILYIDDEEVNLKVFQKLLRREYDIITESNPIKALETFKNNKGIDLVISDQNMPQIKGTEILSKIKEINEDIPTILLSAYSDFNVLKEAINNVGIDRFVSKPLDKENLSSIMNLLIDSARLKLTNQAYRRELIKSEEQYRNIFNSISDIWIRVSEEGQILIVNPAIERHLGYLPQELVNKSFDVIAAEKNELLSILKKKKSKDKVYSYNLVLLTKSGKRKIFQASSNVISSEDGDRFVESLLRDITEEYKLKKELSIKTAVLEEAQSMTQLATIRLEFGENIIYCSDNFFKIFEFKKTADGTASYKKFVDFFPEEKKAQLEKAIQSLEKKKKPFAFDTEVKLSDNSTKNIRIWGSPFEVDKELGSSKGMVATLMDISEEVQNERELIESKDNFAQILEQSPSPVFKLDKNLEITYANEKAEIISLTLFKNNISFKDELRKSFSEFVIRRINSVFKNGNTISLELRNKNSAFFPKWLFIMVNPLKEKGEVKEVIMIFNDVTKIREAEKLLQELNAQLEKKVEERTKQLEKAKEELEEAFNKEKELSRMKSQFVSTASHQFRTPLTVIQSSMGLLELYLEKENITHLQDKFDNLIKRVNSEVNRMTNLMNEVLILGKRETGNLQMELRRFDFIEVLSEVINQYDQIQEDQRTVDFKLVNNSESIITSDPKIIENAISNLISNAFKYSKKSKKNPVVSCVINEEDISLEITDYGIGIPKSDLNQIFEPFYRASNTGDINGTGLGMSIVKTYLEMIGASIEVESKEGQGTTFSILLKKKVNEGTALNS